jgi:glycosyltransferase involved in cell wall biosynthesis
VLEAAAAQLPVIATKVGGIPEIFGPTAASLIAAGDPLALREAMQAVLDDPRAAHIEMKARLAHIAEAFSRERMAGDIAALYGTLSA